ITLWCYCRFFCSLFRLHLLPTSRHVRLQRERHIIPLFVERMGELYRDLVFGGGAFGGGVHSLAHVFGRVAQRGDPQILLFLLDVLKIFVEQLVRQGFVTDAVNAVENQHQPVVIVCHNGVDPCLHHREGSFRGGAALPLHICFLGFTGVHLTWT